MLLYLRCVYANKYTLFGFASAGITCPIWGWALLHGALAVLGENLLESLVLLSVVVSAIPLILTAFGFDSFEACCRALEHFERYGVSDNRFCKRYHTYCDVVGTEVAEQVWNERRNM
jgi:hypothetical protein